ncbi:tetratricopeptide repeat protein [Streptomyces sp. NPDC001089]
MQQDVSAEMSSPYATGGGGVLLEQAYAGSLLAALLLQRPVEGLGDGFTPMEIGFQQGEESPVDDFKVVGKSASAIRTMRVACRRKPIFARSSPSTVRLFSDYLKVITSQADALTSGDLVLGLALSGPYGPASEVATLATIASTRPNPQSFHRAVMTPKAYAKNVRSRLNSIYELIEEATKACPSAQGGRRELTWKVLRSLRVIQLQIEGDVARDRTELVALLQNITGAALVADDLRRRLNELAGRYALSAAVITREMLLRDLGVVRADTSPNFDILPVGDASPLQLGVHRAEKLKKSSSVPPYVPRDADGRIREEIEAARGGGGVLIVGDSTAGKTRSAYEVLRQTFPDGSVIIPRIRSNFSEILDHVATQATLRGKLVVWLDDLEGYLSPDGLTPTALQTLLQYEVIVLCTMRADQYVSHIRPPEDGADVGQRLGYSVLNFFHPIFVERKWSKSEIRRLESRLKESECDERLEEAFLHREKYGIAEYVAAGPKLLAELVAAKRVMGNSRGWAIAAAAIDLARMGVRTPIPESTLMDLSVHYLDSQELGPLCDENADKAIEWATRIRFGVTGFLVASSEKGHWTPFDYLVDNATPITPETADIPEPAWDAAVNHAAENSELLSVGFAAFLAGRLSLAERCCKPDAERGVPQAMYNLAYVQRKRRSEEYVDEWFASVAKSGSIVEARSLGYLHEVEERWEAAEQCYGRAAEQGDGLAMRLIGILCRRKRVLGDEEEWYWKAAEAGDEVSAAYFEQPGIYPARSEVESGEHETFLAEAKKRVEENDSDFEEDDWDDEPWRMTPRTRRILECSLTFLGDTADMELRHLKSDPVTIDIFGLVFAALPASTWKMNDVWRRHMVRAFDDLREDMSLGHTPNPRCPAEEIALHLAIQHASAWTADDMELVEEFTQGLPVQQEDFDWEDCSTFLFEDHDILWLYDPLMQGIENPDHYINQAAGMGDYRPAAWFNFFRDQRDPSRGFRS